MVQGYSRVYIHSKVVVLVAEVNCTLLTVCTPICSSKIKTQHLSGHTAASGGIEEPAVVIETCACLQ